MIIRFIRLTILLIAFAIPALSQQLLKHQKPANSTQASPDNTNTRAAVIPNEQDIDQRSDAIIKNTDQEKSDSQMQKSATAAQNTSDQAEKKLAVQTSSTRVSWSSTGALVWGLLALAGLVILAIIVWRSGRRHAIAPEKPHDDLDRAA